MWVVFNLVYYGPIHNTTVGLGVQMSRCIELETLFSLCIEFVGQRLFVFNPSHSLLKTFLKDFFTSKCCHLSLDKDKITLISKAAY